MPSANAISIRPDGWVVGSASSCGTTALRAGGAGSLYELWEEWQRRGVALATHPDQAPDHHLTSLTWSLDLSWRSPRLRDEGRRLFRLLGQLPAGIAEADRAALLGGAAAEAARQLRAVGLAFDERPALRLANLIPQRLYPAAAGARLR